MTSARPARRRHATTLMAVSACLAISASAVAQAAPLPTRTDLIEVVELAADGTSTLRFTLPPGAADDPTLVIEVLEDGEPVEGLVVEAREVDGEELAPPGTTQVVAVDTSGSTRGEALDAARAAAADFVRRATAQGIATGLVAFADDARLLLAPTTDAEALTAAIGGLEAGGDTALHDALVASARALVDVEGERRVLLFTDGRDEGSEADAGLAAATLRRADVRLDAIALATSASDVPALTALATATGGRVLEVDEAAGLELAFQQAARQLPSHHLASWTSTRAGPDLQLALVARTDTTAWRDDSAVVNPRFGLQGEPRAIEKPTPGLFGGASARPVVLGMFGLLCLVVFGLAAVPVDDPRTRRMLGLARQGRSAGTSRNRHRKDDRAARDSLVDQARQLAEAMPRSTSRDDEVLLRIERAGWRLRPAELLALRLLTALVIGILAAGLFRSLPAAAVGVALGLVAPGTLMERAARKRHDAFVEQLPDVLQLMAGSLKAGHGLLQSLDTVVGEALPPVSTEFRRVVTEHRLGLPLEQALTDLANRIQSDDLRWAIVAMNIQRRVGGNLAELLETVSATVRERARVQRQVQVLAAEGKLSAQVLTVLPFVIGGYVSIINPAYISRLVTDTRGRVMLVGALVLMAAGTVWMRKLIRVEA